MPCGRRFGGGGTVGRLPSATPELFLGPKQRALSQELRDNGIGLSHPGIATIAEVKDRITYWTDQTGSVEALIPYEVPG